MFSLWQEIDSEIEIVYHLGGISRELIQNLFTKG